MLATRRLNQIGQSLWLDDITRDLLDSGALEKFISEWSVTGLTSNPTIFEQAIANSTAYDRDIAILIDQGLSGEDLFFELAIQDLSRAADLFAPIHRRTAHVDGWVSLEVSPLLAHDLDGTVASAEDLYAKANKPNLFIKIPGTKEGLAAIEEAIFLGVPVNVTLLFSPKQYIAAAEAYMRGLERRVSVGLSPDIRSVASVFISRWDAATASVIPVNLKNQLGLAIGKRTYAAYRDLLSCDRWQRLANMGAQAQRLLFASTATKDPAISSVLYVAGLAAPNTVDTMPQRTLKALAAHNGTLSALQPDGGEAAAQLNGFEHIGVDLSGLAEKLQVDGAEVFVKSWRSLLSAIDSKAQVLS